MTIHANQLALEGDSVEVKQFNRCSDLFQKSIDENLSQEQQKEAAEQWLQERQILELGLSSYYHKSEVK